MHELMIHFKNVLVEYKWFSVTLVVMTVLLLGRIPLGTFSDASFLDTTGHFVLPAAGAPLLYVLMHRIGHLPKLRGGATVFMTFLLGSAVEVLWEVFEFFTDLVFRTGWQPSNLDTMIDLTGAVVGSLIGGILFVALYGAKEDLKVD